eukprot:366201-Chlamydomonas_euryale.AAC.5
MIGQVQDVKSFDFHGLKLPVLTRAQPTRQAKLQMTSYNDAALTGRGFSEARAELLADKHDKPMRLMLQLVPTASTRAGCPNTKPPAELCWDASRSAPARQNNNTDRLPLLTKDAP